MSKLNYSELYKHPKWQRRRLEILLRDNFTCQGCGTTEKTLDVHHRYYVPDRVVWNYPDWALITMCNGCHVKTTEEFGLDFQPWELFIASRLKEMSKWMQSQTSKQASNPAQ